MHKTIQYVLKAITTRTQDNTICTEGNVINICKAIVML